MLGAEGVGKTSFCRRWTDDVYEENYTASDNEMSYKKIGLRYPNQMGLVNVELFNTGHLDSSLEAKIAKVYIYSLL